jgi:acyl-CoA reductase-like NAD-dependent aldehyde dehydrogenase
VTGTITTVDPATGLALATYETYDDARIEDLLATAYTSTKAWGTTPVDDRVTVVRRLAELLRKDPSGLADLVTAEMGKPVAEAGGELSKSALTCDYYADRAHALLDDEPVDVGEAAAWVSYEPIGLVLAVMPWNFPVWQAMRFAIPAITAGNGVLLKHSPNVTGCALALESLMRQTGLPTGVFTTLVVEEPRVPEVTERLVADDRIAAVTLTGSNRAGAAVGAAAGRAAKKSVLELGGSDPFVVLDDADVPAAASAAVRARFHNGGQSCVCAKRFVVVEPVAEEFVRLLVEGTQALVVGDPTDPATQVGPLARDDLRGGLRRQVEAALDAGAELLTGGKPVDGAGFFFEPTVLAGAGPGNPIFDEETFGPVAAVAVARDEDHAAELANASAYGLGLSVWTGDVRRGAGFARRITTGAAFVNAVVASDPRLPFGGTKKSGYGRELAAEGLREFVNIRTYWVAG